MKGEFAKPEGAEASPKTRFERIQLPDGQLSIVRPLPKDLPPTFAADLAQKVVEQAERLNYWGAPLAKVGRIPRLVVAGSYRPEGVRLVNKRMATPGEDLKGLERGMVLENTPSAQVAIVDEAKRRYREAYGEELPVEELAAFYIDRKSTEKYMLYRYYPEVKPDLSTEEGKRVSERAAAMVDKLDKRLEAVGVDRGERHKNYLIVESPGSEEGIKIVLIDTELWSVARKTGEAPR